MVCRRRGASDVSVVFGSGSVVAGVGYRAEKCHASAYMRLWNKVDRGTRDIGRERERKREGEREREKQIKRGVERERERKREEEEDK